MLSQTSCGVHVMTEMCKRPVVGLYVDQDRDDIEKRWGSIEAFRAMLQSWNCDRVILMMDRNDGSTRWGAGEVISMVDDLAPISVDVTLWGRHKPADLWGMLRDVEALAWRPLQPIDIGVGIDAEGAAWRGMDPADAGTLAWVLSHIADTRLTTYYSGVHVETTDAAADEVHTVEIQAYSKTTKLGRGWGEPEGPGNFQRAALKRLKEEYPNQRHGIAFPLSGQNYPGHGVKAAMREAFEGAMGCDEYTGWSSKHLYPGCEELAALVEMFGGEA